MRVIDVRRDPPSARPPEVVATIGSFDGVHRGHRVLLGRVVERAHQHRAHSTVITFAPHPRQVLRPDAPLSLLSTLDEKIELLGELGLDYVLIWPFTDDVRRLPAEEFLAQVGRYVRLRRLIHGPGFALGVGRHATGPVLSALGRQLGFDVEEVTPVGDPLILAAHPPDGLPPGSPPSGATRNGEGVAQPVVGSSAKAPTTQVLSSSQVRRLIREGQVQRAAQALGRAPTLTGTVVRGEQVGRALGFPTANLDLAGPLAVPADGVYAGWAETAPHSPRARRHLAAISIGMRPTFGGESRVVEAYLLDFAGDLYGQRLRLHFVARLRGQEHFDGVATLIAQMRRDAETTHALLVPASRDTTGEDLLLAADG